MTTVIIKTLDELRGRAGEELCVSDWLPIDQEQISQFARITRDEQWIHVDPARAQRESPFGAAVAHGFLTLALLSHMLEQGLQVEGAQMLVNYGLNRVRFPAPVPAGAWLRGRFTLQSCEPIAGGLQCIWAATIECRGAPKPCCVAEWVTRIYG